MGFWSKLILGGLGWTLGGPIGAILGVIAAGFFDGDSRSSIEDGGNSSFGGKNSQSRKTTQGDFLLVVMILAGSVMKADGSVLKSELEEVKAFLRANFTEEEGKEALQMLKKILASNYDYRDVCRQVRSRLNYSGKLELIHTLFKIASADGDISQAEINIIYEICHLTGVSDADYVSIKTAYKAYTHGSSSGNGRSESGSSGKKQMSLADAYKILEVDKSATDDEVKKAYRRMAMKYHPDKVNNLGEEVKRSATEKFKAVGEAYQIIKSSRGML
ncbi:MAG: TerB family tellurite resistance protein [Paludibacteraceae bacterium]|nr:TerB family tellurite resistance protein [Paludibacteraceae bacterium]